MWFGPLSLWEIASDVEVIADETEEEDEILVQVIAAEEIEDETEEEDDPVASQSYDELIEDETEETDVPSGIRALHVEVEDETEEEDESLGTTPRDVEVTIEEETIETDLVARGLTIIPMRPTLVETPPEPTLQERLLEMRLGVKETQRDNAINFDEVEKKHNEVVKVVKQLIEDLEAEE